VYENPVCPRKTASLIFSRIAPYRTLGRKCYFIRPLTYTIIVLVVTTSVSFSGFYGLTLKQSQVYKWLTAQILSIMLDILFVPIVRTFIITVYKAWWEYFPSKTVSEKLKKIILLKSCLKHISVKNGDIFYTKIFYFFYTVFRTLETSFLKKIV